MFRAVMAIVNKKEQGLHTLLSHVSKIDSKKVLCKYE